VVIARVLFAVLVGALFSISNRADAGPIDDLLPGHWYEVAHSKLSAVDPCPKRNCSYSGIEGQTAVMSAWSGGAYDSKRDRLIVWGGGHGAYAGNELYAFDLNRLRWSRLTEPSTAVGGEERSGYYPDGAPRSRHTYGYVEYLPMPVDRFCSFGAAGQYPSGQGQIPNVDCFDFERHVWERRADAPSYGIGALAAFDTKSGNVWAHGVGGYGYLTAFDFAHDRWETYGGSGAEGAWLPYEMTAVVEPKRRLFVAVGHGKVLVWKLDSWGSKTHTVLETDGGQAIVGANSPGLVFDPVRDRIVGWSGGANFYSLDLDTKHWVMIAPDAENKIVPTSAQERGTFGRMRYVPSKDVFVVVNRTNENVFIYRPRRN